MKSLAFKLEDLKRTHPNSRPTLIVEWIDGGFHGFVMDESQPEGDPCRMWAVEHAVPYLDVLLQKLGEELMQRFPDSNA